MSHRPNKFEILEDRFLCASDWQNAVLARDVDSSSLVTPLDVLVIINQLNEGGTRILPSRPANSTDPFYDVNGDGWLTPLDALVVINALNALRDRQPTVVSGLSPESDPNNNGVVLRSNVVLNGQTLANALVEAMEIPQLGQSTGNSLGSVLADGEGRFSIGVALALGLHTIRIVAMDDLGRESHCELEIRFGNTIQDWNAAALDVVRQWSTFSNDPYTNRIVTSQPPMVARNLAMIHAAMFDAANAVEGQYKSYKVAMAPQTGASPSAAAASAAFEVAKTLYKANDELAVWQASLDETLAQESDATARELGIEIGKTVGLAIVADRVGDGISSVSSYQPTTNVGEWRRTFPDYLPPLLPQWPNVKPFALSSGDALRPPAPPALGSSEYAAAVAEVMKFGSFANSQRTEEQTEIALFWADGGGTATPPGHWNQIASDVTLHKGNNLVDTARTFALLNIAMADAGIASWDAKYHYDLWRPIDAIRLADQDGSAATTSEATWIPLLKTPPFPTYTSGHSTFSGAASTILASLYGDQTSFDSRADGHSAPEQRPLDPSQIVTRHFDSFSQAAEEAGISRIYGGIHFSFDNTAGLDLGRKIGAKAMARLS